MKSTHYPFRLGTTSYIWPDQILPNVRKLAPKVDDIELLFFESESESNIPTPTEMQELATIANDTGVSYTVHLPLDLYLGDPDEGLRRLSVQKATSIIERTLAVQPFAYNIHFEKRRPDGTEIQNLKGWVESLKESCAGLREVLPKSGLLAVEYLKYPLVLIQDIVDKFGFSYVLDLGHMLLFGIDYIAYLKDYLSKTQVIHLHGICDGNDHLSLAKGNREDLEQIFAALNAANYDRVLTLEVFSLDDYQTSMEVVRQLCPLANRN